MGAESSPTVSLDTAGAGPRPLWQVPVFMAGVAALAAVLVTRAPADSGPRQIERRLSQARQILSRPDGDAAAAAEAAQHALDLTGPDGDRAGEAYFLLGTARMRQGDREPGDVGRARWDEARKALDEAQRLGVPPPEQGRLRWRIAKVSFHSGADPRRVVEQLAASAEEAEDRAEAYDLLSQAYLRLTPPDYQKALEANTKVREQPVLRDDMLARVKLRSGDLKLKLGRADEARKDLEMIGPSAPPAVLSRARLLRARSYQDESKWAEAAAQWQDALKDTREPLADRAEALYLLGVCHRRLDQPEESVKDWDECVRVGAASPAAVAAAVQLAEMRVEHKEFAAAIDLLAGAVARVHKAAEWNNPYAELTRVTDVFEKAAKALRDAGEFKLELQLAGDYERVAAPGRSAILRAEANNGWAAKRLEKPNGAPVAPDEQQAALVNYRQAGDSLLEAVGALPEAGQTELLWQAATRYFEGQGLAQAIATLDRVLKIEKRPERLGQGWFLMGEAFRQSKEPAKAEEAYLTCLNYMTPFAYRARYQLAMLNWEAGRADKAVEILEQNLTQLRYDPDPDAREKSLFALGNFAYQRHDYRGAVQSLEQALAQQATKSDQTRARYQLAESYRQLATDAKRDELIGGSPNPEYKKHMRESNQHYLQKAADEYQELAAILEKPESAAILTAAERDLVPFVAADCRYNLGQYAEALAVYERLLDSKPADRSVALRALAEAARCHLVLAQGDKYRARLEEIHKMLAGVDETVRQQWEEWLSLAARQPLNP
jgi:tetratricopeptide (TPR) repeat protein